MRKDTNRIVELLKEKKPCFQLKSGTPELRSSEQFLSSTSRDTREMERASHAIAINVLNYLKENTESSFVTLETGAGWSTCVLASCQGTHICINPDTTANRLIQEFLDENAVLYGELKFLGEPSDTALPELDKSIQIDLALIDGNHSFPVPIVDWHYIDLHLKVGGKLLLDDTHISGVRIVHDYLKTEESYQMIDNIGRLCVYQKIRPSRTWGWSDQRFDEIYPPSTSKGVQS
jgi:hypothetical protein